MYVHDWSGMVLSAIYICNTPTFTPTIRPFLGITRLESSGRFLWKPIAIGFSSSLLDDQLNWYFLHELCFSSCATKIVKALAENHNFGLCLIMLSLASTFLPQPRDQNLAITLEANILVLFLFFRPKCWFRSRELISFKITVYK